MGQHGPQSCQVNNYIVRSYKDVIVLTNTITIGEQIKHRI